MAILFGQTTQKMLFSQIYFDGFHGWSIELQSICIGDILAYPTILTLVGIAVDKITTEICKLCLGLHNYGLTKSAECKTLES